MWKLVHLNTCTSNHLYIWTCVHLNTCTSEHLYVWTLVHLNTCTSKHEYIWTLVHLNTCTSEHLYTWALVHHNNCASKHFTSEHVYIWTFVRLNTCTSEHFCRELANENNQLVETKTYLIHTWSAKAIKGTVVNRALASLPGGALNITPTVPLNTLLEVWNAFGSSILRINCLKYLLRHERVLLEMDAFS